MAAVTTRRGRTATDTVFAGYVALHTVFVLANLRHLGSWPWFLAANALGLALVVLLQRLPQAALGRPWVAFVSDAYPELLTVAFYTQIGVLNTERGVFHDALIIRWDEALFGGLPSQTWHVHSPSAVLSTVLHFCYGSYYWLVPVPLLVLWFRGRRESFAHGTFAVTLAFYACYAVFTVFPVAGPYWRFGAATGPIAEVLTARVVHRILEAGSAIGAAFPSSHVAVSWVAVLALRREERWLFRVLAPIVVGLALGTVYGGFHYAVDAVAGTAAGPLLFLAAAPLRRRLTPARPG